MLVSVINSYKLGVSQKMLSYTPQPPPLHLTFVLPETLGINTYMSEVIFENTSNTASILLRCWYMEGSNAPHCTLVLAHVNRMCKLDVKVGRDTLLEACQATNKPAHHPALWHSLPNHCHCSQGLPTPPQGTCRYCKQPPANSGFAEPPPTQGLQVPEAEGEGAWSWQESLSRYPSFPPSQSHYFPL